MENYKTRMLFELLDLTVRIEKLKAAIDRGIVMTEQNKALLDRQLKCMKEYKDVLTERLVLDLEGEIK